MSEKGTEKATPQRKKKAREKGDGVRSRDLLSATAMIGGVLILRSVAPKFAQEWSSAYFESVRFAVLNDSKVDSDWIVFMRGVLVHAGSSAAMILVGSFGCCLIVGVVQSGGLHIRTNLIQPNFSKVDPTKNLQNMFSLRSATRLTKSLIPAGLILCLGWMGLQKSVLSVPGTSLGRLPGTFATAYGLLLDAGWILLAWAGLDYATEWKSWNDRLKMGKQEVREEMRDSMGNPLIKGKIRQIQRAMRKQRTKPDLSNASVVITNPTHYAVALQFNLETMQAPTVLAKGRDRHAAKIREEARWANVPIVENPPLARSLYKLVEPGQNIPMELYSAVAGILAFLYRQQVEQQMNGRKEQPENGYRPGMGLLPGRDFGGGM